MKKLVIATSALIGLGCGAAQADSFNLSIGQDEPAYVEPAPAYVVQPEPTVIVGGEHHVYPARDRHHYNWGYWHHDEHPHR